MWYLFIPNNRNLQKWYTGFTDNLFAFKNYTEMMKSFHVENQVEEFSEFDTKNACLDFANRFLSKMSWTDRHTEVFESINELISISSSGIEPTITVVPESVYEEYLEVGICNSNEVTKMLHDLNRLCSPLSIKWLYQYLKPGDKDAVLIHELIARMYEIWKTFTTEYGTDLNRFFVYGEMIWDILDQSYYLRMFIASDILKFTVVEDLDYSSLYPTEFKMVEYE